MELTDIIFSAIIVGEEKVVSLQRLNFNKERTRYEYNGT